MNRLVKISFLAFFFALCGVAIVATHLARERTSAPAARELYAIVNRQLLALRTDDFDSAYRHAASGVQQKFSRAQFEVMIRRDFGSMREAQGVEFGTVQVAGAAALVQVFLSSARRRHARLSLQLYGGRGQLENRWRNAPWSATVAPPARAAHLNA